MYHINQAEDLVEKLDEVVVEAEELDHMIIIMEI